MHREMPRVSTAMTEILYKDPFWWAVWLVLGVVIYFARRRSPPPFPRVGEFFAKHKKGITRISDILLICLVLLWSLFPLSFVKEVFNDLSNPEPTRTTLLRASLTFFFTFLIVWSGISGFFVGLLSVFHSNLTRAKRIILLIVCLLPIAFTVLATLVDIADSPWLIIQICFYYSLGSWIINASAILIGKHFSQVLGDTVQKVKSVLRDRSG